VLHFKFLPDLSARIRTAIELNNYWDGSFEYKCYAKAIQSNAEMSLRDTDSVKYTGPLDLVSRGLIQPIGWPQRSSYSKIAQKTLRQHRAERLSTLGLAWQTGVAVDVRPSQNRAGRDDVAAVEVAESEFVGFLPGTGFTN
jgi:hypothetical protein